MKKPYWLLSLFLLIFGIIFIFSFLKNRKHTAPDTIKEIHNLSQIYNYLDKDDYNQDTLVLFDIDNTLLAPPTDLGSDQWFYAMHKHYMDQGHADQDAIDMILPLYKQVIFETDFEPIEHDTVSIVKDLQNKGLRVIALTARSLDLCYRTIEQLNQANIVFDKEHQECPIKYGDKKPALFIEGAVFSGNYNKGEVLASWLDQTHYKPRKIIFVDDKLKNVESVEHALHKRDIPFIGLRYGHLDKRVQHFDWNKTEKELNTFIKRHPESRPIPAY